MASKYSIVQYVPNPIADERINIGVVAFDQDKVGVRFLHNWERVEHFGMENIDFLKDFAQRMQEAASLGLLFPGDRDDDTPKHERLKKVARGWMNSVQFTEPRGSLESVDSLLEDIAETYLIPPKHSKVMIICKRPAKRPTIRIMQQIFKSTDEALT